MKNIKLGFKLTGGFATIALLTAILGYVAYSGISATDEALRDVALNRLPSVMGLGI